MFNNFTNGTAYKISCKDKTLDLTAKVGEVVRIAINTASAEQNVETPIDFTLFDAEGIDVTPAASLDTTCYVTIDGSYSAASLDRASRATITMSAVGDKADVTITYNNNNVGAQDVKATQTITCVDAKAVLGTKLFTSESDTVYINKESNCAKFYLNLSDTSVTVSEGGSSTVYFCAKDSKGDVISYDSYEVESSNDDVASSSMPMATGKFAMIEVNGNTIGNATLNVKATKNGKDTYYTVPVTVVKEAELASMRVSVSKPTMSDVNDPDYTGAVIAELYDKNGNRIDGDVSCTLVETTASTPIVVTSTGYNRWTGVAGVYTAGNADARSYTIKVTAADKNTGKTIERNVSVNVRKLADASDLAKGLKLTYQVETSRNTIDANPLDRTDDSVTTRLYATYNGLFAGYVRCTTESGIKIADGSVNPIDAIEDVKVVAKYGTKFFLPGQGLYAPINTVTGGAVQIGADGEVFDAVKAGSAITWTPEGSNDLAKTGQYTVEYRIYTAKGTHKDPVNNQLKYTPRTQTFTVKNTVTVPTVTVLSRTTKGLDAGSIRECLKTSVDMNNNSSDYESITGTMYSKLTDATLHPNNNKVTVKYVEVEDTYTYTTAANTTVDVTWTFLVPINTTFTLE